MEGWTRIGLGVFAFIAALCTAVAYGLMFAGASGASAVSNLLDDVAILFALAAALDAARRTSGDLRKMWILIAAGVVSWIVGESFYDARLVSAHAQPQASASDDFYMGFYLAIIAGLWVRDRATRKRGFDVRVIDSIVVALAISIVGWGVVYDTAAAAAVLDETGRIVYPVVEGLLIWSVAYQLYNPKIRWDTSRWLLALAVFATFTSGILFAVVGGLASGTMMSLAMTLVGVSAFTASDTLTTPRSDDLPHRAHLPEAVLILAWAGIAVVAGFHFAPSHPTLALLVGAAMSVIVLRLVTVYAMNERLLKASELRAATDPLTGLGNRQYFHERMDAELARAGREGDKLALLLIDIDNFKTINDLAGHRTGDRVLRQIAQRLRDSVRPFDVVCRIGGDELAIIAPDADGEAALDIGKRVCHNVRKIKLDEFPDAPRVSVSVGCTYFPDFGGDVTELIDTADEALYTVKTEGRGVALLYSPYAKHPHDAEWQLNRVRAELAARNADFQAVFRHAQEAMVIFDDEGNLLLVNDAASTMFRASRERMIGRRLSEFVQPDAVEAFRAILPQLLDDGRCEGKVDVVIPGLKKGEDSARATIEYSSSRFAPNRYLSIMWDITEEDRAAALLAENERRFRAIFESSIDPIFITDDYGIIREANLAAADMAQRSLPELIGTSVADLVHARDVENVATHLDELRDLQTRRGVFRTLDEDGVERTVEYSSVADFVPGMHLTIVRDITHGYAAPDRVQR